LNESFSLTGKVIGENNSPFSNHKVLAYDKDPLLNPDDFLGESIINDKGFFQIEFDKTKFVNILEVFEGTPDIFLVLKDQENKETLQTREMKTKKEIEYHIKITKKNIPDPNAPDIYSGNGRRMINFLRDLGTIIDLEFDVNKKILNRIEDGDNSNNAFDSKSTKDKSQDFLNNYDQIQDNFNSFLVISQGLINNYLKELNLGTIQYDGPQVPRFPHKNKYNQVIIWPRKEKFKWE
jgi:hypothetical protein